MRRRITSGQNDVGRRISHSTHEQNEVMMESSCSTLPSHPSQRRQNAVNWQMNRRHSQEQAHALYLRMYRFLRRASGSLRTKRFRSPATSIMRLSFLKSSFGLARNGYSRPSLPRRTICEQLRIQSRSSKTYRFTQCTDMNTALRGTQHCSYIVMRKWQTFLGFCREDNTSTSSFMPAILITSP